MTDTTSDQSFNDSLLAAIRATRATKAKVALDVEVAKHNLIDKINDSDADLDADGVNMHMRKALHTWGGRDGVLRYVALLLVGIEAMDSRAVLEALIDADPDFEDAARRERDRLQRWEGDNS